MKKQNLKQTNLGQHQTQHFPFHDLILFRSFFLSTSLLLLAFQISAQPAIEWEITFGGTMEEQANDIQQTSDGGYIVVGTADSFNGDVSGNNGNGDAWIVKLSNTGALEWQNAIGGSNPESANSVLLTDDGGYLLCGTSMSTNGDVSTNYGGEDVWVVKLNSTGNIEWEKSYGGPLNEGARSIQKTDDGGFIMVGQTNSTLGDITSNNGEIDVWVLKIDNSGVLEWEQTFGGALIERGGVIKQTTDGGFIFTGHSESIEGDLIGNQGSFDLWVVKLDNSGAIEWQKNYGGNNSDFGNDILQTTDGGYIVAGQTSSSDGDVVELQGLSSYWVLKLNESGEIEWQDTYGGLLLELARSIVQTLDGSYVVGGFSASPVSGDISSNQGLNDFWLVNLSNTGVINWELAVGGSETDIANAVIQTTDEGYALAGFSSSTDGDVSGTPGNERDFWIVKFAPVPVNTEKIPNAIEISIYPNPATDKIYFKTDFDFTNAEYTIFNQLGQSVLSGKTDNFDKSITIDHLLTGVYLIQISMPGKLLATRFVKK